MIESSPAIRAGSLSAGYVDRRVLHDLDFEVASGKTAVLVGPGGAGKTTFLRALSGETFAEHGFWKTGNLALPPHPPCLLWQKPSGGRATVAELFYEEGCRETPCQWRDHCPSYQFFAPASTARGEQMRFLSEQWECAPEAARSLAAILQSPLSTLPTALLRLAAFTATVARGSPYLLLDEPAADMEPFMQDWVIRKLRSLRGMTTVVLVTHNLRFARAVADSVHLLIDGEIWEAAPAERFFSRPRHPRTRDFVRLGC